MQVEEVCNQRQRFQYELKHFKMRFLKTLFLCSTNEISQWAELLSATLQKRKTIDQSMTRCLLHYYPVRKQCYCIDSYLFLSLSLLRETSGTQLNVDDHIQYNSEEPLHVRERGNFSSLCLTFKSYAMYEGWLNKAKFRWLCFPKAPSC